MNEPIHDLIRDALSLLHPAFLDRSQSHTVACEFYHQFRKLWDKGVPVGYGLGHLIIRPLDATSFAIRRLGEGGTPAEDLTTVHFAPITAAPPGFRHTLLVIPMTTLTHPPHVIYKVQPFAEWQRESAGC